MKLFEGAFFLCVYGYPTVLMKHTQKKIEVYFLKAQQKNIIVEACTQEIFQLEKW